MALPDSSRLVVDTRVREVDLHKIATGQQVLVTVEAYPDLRLNATVELVGALAEDDATRAGVKYFPVTVALIDVDPRLRTGMTARVGIEVASRPNALVVPVHAIFEDETGSGETYCVVLRNGRPQRVDVQVGANNGLFAAVTSGLAQGDEVLLVDPTTKDVS
jgi:HlyD family secretion protein